LHKNGGNKQKAEYKERSDCDRTQNSVPFVLSSPRSTRGTIAQALRCRQDGGADVHFTHFTFGAIEIDGVTYDHDLVIDRGEIHARKKKASKKFRDAFGHTPLSAEEDIPWKCDHLVIGTGAYGRLPVMDDVKREAKKRGVQLIVLPTADAIKVLQKESRKTNAILHVTC
jgi:hypothetical protein